MEKKVLSGVAGAEAGAFDIATGGEGSKFGKAAMVRGVGRAHFGGNWHDVAMGTHRKQTCAETVENREFDMKAKRTNGRIKFLGGKV